MSLTREAASKPAAAVERGRRVPTATRRAAVALAVVLALTGLLHAQLAPPPSGASQSSSVPSTSSALAPAPPPVRGRYLDAVPSVLRTTAAAGGLQRVTLAVDVTPKPSMRVYAPGNASYSAVTVTLDTSSGVASEATTYPKAEEFLFAPLDERVKVYSAPFRLTRAVTVATYAKGALASTPVPGLVITGRLEYQACDDKVCYLPQTLPLTWTVLK